MYGSITARITNEQWYEQVMQRLLLPAFSSSNLSAVVVEQVMKDIIL
jgi:hypothetical protein